VSQAHGDRGRLDYRSAGVVRRTHGPRVLRGLGHFGGFFRIGPAGDRATLVASTDSVGTKLKIAILAQEHSGIGTDLVHHCINDIIACGARPLFFLDYYATGHLDPAHAAQIVESISAACEEFGVALIGGETAELPGIYAAGDYDVAGFIVGMVDADSIVDGSAIRAGDVVLGLPSSGFHTNGYSLVRAALRLNEESSEFARELLQLAIGDEHDRPLERLLLEPHRCYAREVGTLLDAEIVQGMAHITGGGIAGNVARIVPSGLTVEVDPTSWDVPAVIEFVINRGEIERAEAFKAFNMGIGFVVIVRERDVPAARNAVADSRVIGRVVTGSSGDRVRIMGLT
jgi:phosphoribosylformylglycinamidine cyclo-ligase